MTAPEELAPEPIEPDPTGVRALLAGLPDPGPMPPDVADRVLAALQAERTRSTLPMADADVVPLATRRPTAPRRRWFAAVAGIAASAVLALTLGGALRENLLPSFGGSADSAAAGSAGAPAREGPSALASTQDAEAAPTALLLSTGRSYTAGDLASEAARLATIDASPATGDQAAIPLATPEGLRACLATLGESGAKDVVADVATYDGAPAAILHVITREATVVAYAVDRRCGDPEITDPRLAGPVALPAP